MAAATRRSDRLDRLERIIQTQSLLVRGDLDPEPFMQLIVDRLQDVTQARGAVIEFADGDGRVYRSAGVTAAQHLGLRIAAAATSLSGLCVRTASVLRCDDAEKDARVDREVCHRVGVRSMICAPLFRSGAAIGVLKVFSDRAHAFDGGDVQMLELTASAIAAALDKQKALDAGIEAEARLRSSETRMRAMLEHANDAIVSVDDAGRVSLWNCAAERLFGWAAGEAIGRLAADMIVPPALRCEFARAVAGLAASDLEDAHQRVTIPAVDRSGRELSVEISLTATRVDGCWELSAFGHDVSERRRLEARLREMALCDGLTGLANRRGFMETLDKAVSRAQRAGQPMALLFLDLDRFKEINDRFGHHVGDVALQTFARRLELCVRKGDTIARLGGDEFTVLAEGVASIDQARAIVDKIVEALEPPLDATGVRLRASIGVSLYRAPSDASQFLREADRAMYRDKKRRAAPQAFAASRPVAAEVVDDEPGAGAVPLGEAG